MFKNRAEHFVFADPDNAMVVRGIASQNMASLWNEISISEGLQKCDEHATFPENAQLLNILDRLQRMQVHLRKWETEESRGLMFACINHRGDKVQLSKRTLSEMMPGELLSRRGITFSSIRKSFLNSMSSAGFEPRMISELAGQRSLGILQRNYIVGSSAARTYEQPIRFFQSCIQELVLNEGIALRLGIPQENRDWFKTLSDLTGITGACGISASQVEDGEADFVLNPTISNLIDLALAHRGIKSERMKVPRQRWEIQGHAVLGLIKALGRTLINSGLGKLYRSAARTANSLLRRGEASLPQFLEI